MSENPHINALSATLYVTLVAFIMFNMEKTPDSVHSLLVPIAMLSLFVLSAGIMGYIFCYKPIELLVGGKRKEALNLFLKTIGVFAIITLLLFCALFVFAK
jgi:hypothetical protein